MIDPYPAAKDQLSQEVADIEAQTNFLSQLRQGGSKVPEDLEQDIRDKISAAEKKLQNIIEANRVVANDPSRFGLSQEGVTSRQNFANTIRQRINNVNNILNTKPAVSKSSPSYASGRKEHLRKLKEADNQRFIDEESATQQQMMQEGDEQIDLAVEATHKINLLANQIGDELHADKERRDDIEDHMDRTQVQMDRLIDKTRELLDQPKTWMWIGCVVLTIIVIILIIWVFLF